MLEWLLRILERMFGKRSDAAIREADTTRKNYESLLAENRALNAEYKDLMKLTQTLAEEMRQRLESLEDELVSIRAELERERLDHKDCRQRLAKHEEQIMTLKGAVEVIRQHQSDH